MKFKFFDQFNHFLSLSLCQDFMHLNFALSLTSLFIFSLHKLRSSQQPTQHRSLFIDRFFYKQNSRVATVWSIAICSVLNGNNDLGLCRVSDWLTDCRTTDQPNTTAVQPIQQKRSDRVARAAALSCRQCLPVFFLLFLNFYLKIPPFLSHTLYTV